MAAAIPVRFGEASRQLFGLFHPPAGGAARTDCVVMCNPFGQEAIRAHRLLKVLAERLSLEGFPVLRFDYFGTGDSDGDDEAGTMAIWTEDILRADREAKRMSGHHGSSWFGLRLGATLACRASANARLAPHRLVLWDPVVDGTTYLHELAEAHDEYMRQSHLPQFVGVEDVHGDGDTQALGYPITTALRREIRAISSSGFLEASRAERFAVVASGGYAELAAVQASPTLAGAEVHQVATHIVWASEEALNTAIAPADAMQAVVQSLTGAG